MDFKTVQVQRNEKHLGSISFLSLLFTALTLLSLLSELPREQAIVSFSQINLLNNLCSLIHFTRSCRFNPDQARMHDPSSAKFTGEHDVHAGFILLGWFALTSGQQIISNPI